MLIFNFSESEMISICDGDEQCLFDAKAIGILAVGEQTKNNHRYYKFLDEALKPGINRKIAVKIN